MKAASLFVEQDETRTAFYIDGDLQFDSQDETIYHEFLVFPAISLARVRFPDTELRVLVCGGGDGLAVRDILRFSGIGSIDLVDYNPEVVRLGRTLFAPFNRNAFASPLLTIHTQDAFSFVQAVTEHTYHAVICDFTHPRGDQDADVFGVEWFSALSQVLCPDGIIVSNGTSPEASPEGFWCIHQSILAAQFYSYPLHAEIPSFRQAGYGRWGFFLASPTPLVCAEIEAVAAPDGPDLFHKHFAAACRFPRQHAAVRHAVACHRQTLPVLCHYLWNSEYDETLSGCFEGMDERIDFLTVPDCWNGVSPQYAPGSLVHLARTWLEAAQSSDPQQYAGKNVVPVRHAYHTTEMTNSWQAALPAAARELDLVELVRQMLKRAQALPANLVEELRNLLAALQCGKMPEQLSPRLQNMLWLILALVLSMNLSHPEAVFAKGGGSGGSSDGNELLLLGGTGFTYGGIVWLAKLLERSK